ncbi:MAG: hypothetical protein GC157_18360 [Frankiales bacterium]|nr:hypothetical protein [Frankiales bacterium]
METEVDGRRVLVTALGVLMAGVLLYLTGLSRVVAVVLYVVSAVLMVLALFVLRSRRWPPRWVRLSLAAALVVLVLLGIGTLVYAVATRNVAA